MKAHCDSFTIQTRGKGTRNVTGEVERIVAESGVQTGNATVFLRHTSASLVIYEDADRSARADLENFFERIAPENGDYEHGSEGADDATSHLRMALTRTSETIPVMDGRLHLGTWQGIFLFEHRRAPRTREIVVSVLGV